MNNETQIRRDRPYDIDFDLDDEKQFHGNDDNNNAQNQVLDLPLFRFDNLQLNDRMPRLQRIEEMTPEHQPQHQPIIVNSDHVLYNADDDIHIEQQNIDRVNTVNNVPIANLDVIFQASHPQRHLLYQYEEHGEHDKLSNGNQSIVFKCQSNAEFNLFNLIELLSNQPGRNRRVESTFHFSLWFNLRHLLRHDQETLWARIPQLFFLDVHKIVMILADLNMYANSLIHDKPITLLTVCESDHSMIFFYNLLFLLETRFKFWFVKLDSKLSAWTIHVESWARYKNLFIKTCFLRNHSNTSYQKDLNKALYIEKDLLPHDAQIDLLNMWSFTNVAWSYACDFPVEDYLDSHNRHFLLTKLNKKIVPLVSEMYAKFNQINITEALVKIENDDQTNLRAIGQMCWILASSYALQNVRETATPIQDHVKEQILLTNQSYIHQLRLLLE